MQGYLIDPAAHTITPVQYGGDYREISRQIGCDLFTAVYMDDGDTLYLDDEGLLKGPTDFFMLTGYTNPLAGKALVLGSDHEGETTAAKISLDDLTERITFGSVVSLMGMVAFIPA